MRTYILLATFFFITSYSRAQKSPIRFSDLGTWPALYGAQISPDGQYVLYNFINNVSGTRTLVIKSSNLDWERDIVNGTNPSITWDSRKVVFSLPGDSLGILKLGTQNIEFIAGVKDYQVSKEKAGIWIAYLKTNNPKSLIVRNEITKEERQFPYVDNYIFSEDGSALILTELDAVKQKMVSSVVYFSLSDQFDKVIWKNELKDSINVDNIKLNRSGTQIAFCIREAKNGGIYSSIYYFRRHDQQAIRIYSDSDLQINRQLSVVDISRFSRNNDLLFIHVTHKESPSCKKMDMARVDIWSSEDDKLQSEQLYHPNERRTYLARIDLSNGQLLQLTTKNETERVFDPQYIDDRYIMIKAKKRDIDDAEANWNPNYGMTIYLENVYTGRKKFFGSQIPDLSNGMISPSGRYFVYFDGRMRCYYSYAIASGVITNITKGIDTDWSLFGYDFPDASLHGQPIAGWVAGQEFVLIYDQWDVWLIDLAGKRPAVNLTNAYGRKHDIQFRLPIRIKMNILSLNDTFVLNAFNRRTKENGFYLKTGLKSRNPELLNFGNFLFTSSFHGDSYSKAENANVYVVQRESCSEFPNYYVTKDFKSYVGISRLEPEKEFNWISSRVVNWKTSDGKDCQGILYLPENFNLVNKYPLIINYYEKKSDELNHYLLPEMASDNINIPWFVSNGYIVFVPDIHYQLGNPGVSAYNCIISGVQVLARNQWVDQRRMGLQGHSFGGYETDYVITHSKIFAAAMSASGICDLIGEYLSLWRDGVGEPGFVEMGQMRMKFNLWQNRELYILNSPIFNTDQVQTPLLMMNNKSDDVVPFSQGTEFYLALRRLGKKVWMLQYDGEGHVLDGNEAKRDYTLRMTEFFDYFLKHSQSPEWITHGIPAKEKGCVDGF